MDLDTDWPILSILSRKICKRHFIYFLDTLRFSWTSAVKECFCFLFFSFCDGKECLTWANVLITNILTEGLAVWRHILHLPATGGRPTPAVPVQAPWLAGCLHSNHSRVLPFLTSRCSQSATFQHLDHLCYHTVAAELCPGLHSMTVCRRSST